MTKLILIQNRLYHCSEAFLSAGCAIDRVSSYAQGIRFLCCAVLCCAVLCCAVLCCAVLCCAVLCCAVLWPKKVRCDVLCDVDITCPGLAFTLSVSACRRCKQQATLSYLPQTHATSSCQKQQPGKPLSLQNHQQKLQQQLQMNMKQELHSLLLPARHCRSCTALP